MSAAFFGGGQASGIARIAAERNSERRMRLRKRMMWIAREWAVPWQWRNILLGGSSLHRDWVSVRAPARRCIERVHTFARRSATVLRERAARALPTPLPKSLTLPPCLSNREWKIGTPPNSLKTINGDAS